MQKTYFLCVTTEFLYKGKLFAFPKFSQEAFLRFLSSTVQVDNRTLTESIRVSDAACIQNYGSSSASHRSLSEKKR